ncbi:MAG TPA: palindromic element RPE4 domain-containing protein [Rickettsia endosymbiont of Omalisus fontisbellaquei]|nr:palindromic element RPE4 domain-containing protein [Rickettsia endosymbiont of Omalisus fontisbellaquei]
MLAKYSIVIKHFLYVIPAKAGIHFIIFFLDTVVKPRYDSGYPNSRLQPFYIKIKEV